MTSMVKQARQRLEPEGYDVLPPKPGPQTEFLASSADVTLWVDTYGAGLTTGLLLDWIAMSETPTAAGLFVRSHHRDLVGWSGTFDVAERIYAGTGACSRRSHVLDMRWPSGATLEFAGITRENYMDYGAIHYTWIGVDQCEDYDPSVLAFLATRLRPDNGLVPRMRLVGHDLPRGFSRPLAAALNRTSWPGPGAQWMAVDKRSNRLHLGPEWAFGPTQDATAEIAGCDPDSVCSFALITGR